MNDNSKYILSVEIGGSHVTSALVSKDGAILDRSLEHMEVDSSEDQNFIFDKWALAIRRSMMNLGLNNLQGISFAIPGPFDYSDGTALFKGNNKYESLYGLNVIEELRKRLKLPEYIDFRFLNDATSFAVGASWTGKTSAYDRSIVVTLGTGFGSAFVDKGVPIFEGTAVPEHGCLWHLPYKNGIIDDYFSTRWFEAESFKKYGVKINGVKSLVQAGKHKYVEEIFTQFGTNLGEILSPWIKKFEAQAVLLGGNISKAFGLFSQAMNESLEVNGLSTKIFASEEAENEALVGAARLFDEQLWPILNKNHSVM
ncbi:ROK family protein [Flavivirga sp. 57AJ16]|uniref:ROK family protein n=1 Tax=Flavivirga sp. 57AJ16 TaxID=3025307 RepID=UPI0023653D06|nr:ROK family protein [Flavivirga sp. 57AJ16]MDD7885445.1 ROK family protein [Flavivirga sp. 57AJ16]